MLTRCACCLHGAWPGTLLSLGITWFCQPPMAVMRLGFLALGLLNGFGLMVYVVLWLLVPNEDSAAADAQTLCGNPGDQPRAEQLYRQAQQQPGTDGAVQ
mgnify:CR=1 FL=1